MLEIKNLTTFYGPIKAIENVSLKIERNEIISIIGANGAGKTTLLNSISGLVKPKSGEIYLNNEKLPSKPHKVVKKGIVQVPEGRKVFSDLKVEENLRMGGFLINNKTQLNKNFSTVYELFPILKKRKNQYAGTLSGGEQQMLSIGRALMSNPDLMLLDEPSLGLAPQLVNQVFDLIERISLKDISILLVEQNAQKALELCDFGYVLENGIISLSGKGNELIQNKKVKEAYLG